jgi:hypothetical protein
MTAPAKSSVSSIRSTTGRVTDMIRRRDFIMRTAALTAAGGLLAPAPAQAQDAWPQRTVSIVVPFAAGGSADLLGRLLAQHMQAKFNVPFVVENRGGRAAASGPGWWQKPPRTATRCCSAP